MDPRPPPPAPEADPVEPLARWARSPGGSWRRPAPASPDAGAVRGGGARRLVTLSRVLGAAVFDHRGRRLGRVADVVFRDAAGAVAYVILVRGGFLGLGGATRRAAWSALAYDPRRGGFVLTSTDEPAP